MASGGDPLETPRVSARQSRQGLPRDAHGRTRGALIRRSRRAVARIRSVARRAVRRMRLRCGCGAAVQPVKVSRGVQPGGATLATGSPRRCGALVQPFGCAVRCAVRSAVCIAAVLRSVDRWPLRAAVSGCAAAGQGCGGPDASGPLCGPLAAPLRCPAVSSVERCGAARCGPLAAARCSDWTAARLILRPVRRAASVGRCSVASVAPRLAALRAAQSGGAAASLASLPSTGSGPPCLAGRFNRSGRVASPPYGAGRVSVSPSGRRAPRRAG